MKLISPCKYLILAALVMALLAGPGLVPARADVLTTKDGMILNGRVIKKDDKVTVFSNFYGTFTIENAKIKALYETRKFEEDIKLMKNMGKEVNEKEAERNFQTGTEKKSIAEGSSEETEESAGNFHIKLVPGTFFMFNIADLHSVLPWSLGGTLSADFLYSHSLKGKKNIYIPDIRVEFSYLYADKGAKNINGFGLTAGPYWNFLLTEGTAKPTLRFTLMAGGGNYHVENSDEETRRFSFNSVALFGVSFTFGYVEVSPEVRYSYIHDAEAPLHSVGFNLGFAFRVM